MSYLKKILPLILFAFCFNQSYAQSADETAVKTVIETLFKGMANKDSTTVASVFHPSARLQNVVIGKDNMPGLTQDEIPDFVKSIKNIPPSVKIEERVLSYEISVDGNLATVWTPYEFYVNNKMSHCGVDAFQLFKDDKGKWLIFQVADTRRKDCK